MFSDVLVARLKLYSDKVNKINWNHSVYYTSYVLTSTKNAIKDWYIQYMASNCDKMQEYLQACM